MIHYEEVLYQVRAPLPLVHSNLLSLVLLIVILTVFVCYLCVVNKYIHYYSSTYFLLLSMCLSESTLCLICHSFIISCFN